MNWRLILLKVYLPGFLKRRGITELYQRTARAFGGGSLDFGERAYPAMLAAYAEFTRDMALAALRDSRDLAETERRLRDEAREMGGFLRRELRLRTEGDLRAALRLFYRTLGIDLRVSPAGEVVIRSCFFSAYYSAPVCRLISALDDGLARGLSGGRGLCFKGRLTEGAASCRAMMDNSKC